MIGISLREKGVFIPSQTCNIGIEIGIPRKYFFQNYTEVRLVVEKDQYGATFRSPLFNNNRTIEITSLCSRTIEY